MHIESIELRKANGTQFGIELEDLSPVVNVVLSPNGSGKTTLCRTIRGLLWPQASDVPGALDARITCDAGTGNSFAGSTHWSPSPPVVPDVHAAPCYTLTIDEMMAVDGRGDLVIETIEREFAGGLDFKRASKAINAHPVSGLTKRRKEIDAAEEEVRRALNVQAQLREQLKDHDRLEKQEKAGAESVAELEAVRNAVDLQAVRAELEKNRRGLDALPSLCSRLRGDELSRLGKREDAARERSDEVRASAAILEKARTSLEAIHPDIERVHETALTVASSRVEAAIQSAKLAGDARRNAQSLLESAARDRARLGMTEETTGAVAPSTETIELLDQLIQVQNECRGLQSISGNLEDLGSTNEPTRRFITAFIFGLVLALVVAAVTALVGGGTATWLASGAVAGLGAFGYLLFGRAGPGAIDALVRKQAARSQEDLENARAREQELAQSLRDAGVMVEKDGLLLARDVAERMGRLADVDAEVARESALADTHDADRERRLQQVRDELLVDGGDEHELAARIKVLESDYKLFQDATVAWNNARMLAEQATKELDDFYEELGLEPSEESRHELKEALPHVDSWSELRDTVRRHEDNVARLEGELEGRVSLAEEDPDALQGRIAQLESDQEAGVEAGKKRFNLQSNVDTQRDSTQVSRLQSMVEERVDDFKGDCDEMLEMELASFMLEDCRATVASEADSNQLLGRIRGYFRRVTHGAYTVLGTCIDEDSGALGLMVRSNVDGIKRQVHELSTGIRMQLLVCMRMSILAGYEAADAPIPVVFDDALGNLDSDGLRATVDLLLELSCEGRQVFYLTHDREDAQAWVDAARERGIEVGLRSLASGDPPAEVDLPPVTSVPKPDSEDVSAYARKVNAARPSAVDPPDSLNVVHLFPDNVHKSVELLERRARTVGIAAVGADEDPFLEERIEVVRALLGQLAIGVSRPPDPALLEQFTGKTGEAISRFVTENEGSVRDLIDAIRTNDPSFKGIRGRDDVLEVLEATDRLNGYGTMLKARDAAGYVCAELDLEHHAPADVEQLAGYFEELLEPSRRG